MNSKLLRLEKRTESRLSLYSGELPRMLLTVDGDEIDSEICDLATGGLGVVLADENKWKSSWQRGQTLRLRFIDSKELIRGIVTQIGYTRFDGQRRFRIGIEYNHGFRKELLRSQSRYQLPLSHSILLNFYHPNIPNKYLFARVTNFSSTGFGFCMDIDETNILPLMLTMRGQIHLPTNSIVDVSFQIRHARVIDEKRFYGGIIVESHSPYSRDVAEYLLVHDSNPTIRQLSDEGFEVEQTARVLKYSVAVTEDLADVVELRQKTQQHYDSGWNQIDATGLDAADLKCRHILCKIEQRLVAAVCLKFNESSLTPPGQAEAYSLPNFFKKHGYIEVSRIHVDPDFQVLDIYMNLVRHLAGICLSRGDKYLVVCCNDRQSEYFNEFGAIDSGYRLQSGTEQPTALNILIIDAKRCRDEAFDPTKPSRIESTLNNERKLSLIDELRLRFYRNLFRAG